MNEVLKAIATRRSVRKFDEKRQIKDADLNDIVLAGLQAPTGHNDQSVYLVVIQKPELIKELSDGSKLEMQKMPVPWIASIGKNEAVNIYYNAPTVIIVSARKDAVSPVADVCAAIQNILISATSLNIATCWIGFAKFYFNTPERNKQIGILDGYEVHYAVALGFAPAGMNINQPERKHKKYYHIIK